MTMSTISAIIVLSQQCLQQVCHVKNMTSIVLCLVVATFEFGDAYH